MEKFEIERYLGDWHEIAKIPLKWEVGCTFAKANYSWDSKRNVLLVRNDCLDENEKLKYSRTGIAYIPDMKYKSRLRIKFNPPSDPEGNYIVLYTDYEKYSIVSNGVVDGGHVWVLARKNKISKADARFLLRKVEAAGYDPNKLIANSKVIY